MISCIEISLFLYRKFPQSRGAIAVRVRATGSPRAHPLEVVGHGRRSPRFRNPLTGAQHLGFLVNSETRHTEGANNLGFLVNSETRHKGRDTQKERTTKSRNSWGAKAVTSKHLGFLVNSKTRHSTEGANNQISD